MGVKCPKHNVDLTIEYTSINMLGNKYPVVAGQCPKCKIKYLSREIMSSSGSFKIGGQAYEYLNAMEMAYPHPFKPLSQTQPILDDPVCNEISSSLVVADEKITINKEAKAVKPDEERALKREEAKKATMLKKMASGKGRIFHVHRLCYPKAIPEFCLNDRKALVYADRIFVHIGERHVETKGWYCRTCKMAYIPEEFHAKTREKLRQADLDQHTSNIVVLQKAGQLPIPNEPVNLAIPQNTLYVCKGTVACKRNGHSIQSATGVLLTKNGALIKINTNYCPQCRKYFISHDEYMYYRKLYGILLGNLKATNGSFVGTQTDLAEESILHMCGYSVNQTDNLSPAARQGVLQYLIDSTVSNKPEIINYLNFFIKRNGKKQNMTEAVRRWNEDLKWIREYQINRQRHFEIANIQKNTK